MDELLLQTLTTLQAQNSATIEAVAGISAQQKNIALSVDRLAKSVHGQNGSTEESLHWRVAQLEKALRGMEKARADSRANQLKLWVALIAAFGGIVAQAIAALAG